MSVLYLILLIAAAVCFILAAAGVAARRVNLIALGLLLITIVWIVQLVDGPGFEATLRKPDSHFGVTHGG